MEYCRDRASQPSPYIRCLRQTQQIRHQLVRPVGTRRTPAAPIPIAPIRAATVKERGILPRSSVPTLTVYPVPSPDSADSPSTGTPRRNPPHTRRPDPHRPNPSRDCEGAWNIAAIERPDPHRISGAFARLSRFAINWYAPSEPAAHPPPRSPSPQSEPRL